LDQCAHAAEQQNVKGSRSADQELKGVAHRTEVSADVHGVGEQEQADDRLQYPVRVVPGDVSGDAAPRRTADPGADLLNDCHQRICEQQRPTNSEPELGTRLRIGSNSARIIVGGARDEAGAKRAKGPYDAFESDS
jgi:hypothetical protein